MNHILQGWQGDFGIYVDEYLSSIEAVPGQMNTLMSEIAEKDQETTVVLTEARANDVSLRKMIRATPTPAIPPTSFSSSFADLLDPDQLSLLLTTRTQMLSALPLMTEKISLADRALALLDRQLQRLTNDITLVTSLEHVVAPPQAIVAAIVAPAIKVTSPRSPIISPRERRQAVSVNASTTGPPKRKRDNRDKEYRRKRDRQRLSNALIEAELEPVDTELYCHCREVSYGEMVACDGEECPYEWFHYTCVSLEAPPVGRWYCEACAVMQ